MSFGGRKFNAGRSPGSRAQHFRPGISGNYRPKNGHAISQVAQLKRALLEEISEDEWRKVVRTILREAKAGKEWACREIADRLIGRAVQQLDVQVDVAPAKTGTETQMLEILVRECCPEHMWPPMMLERYKAGLLKLPPKQIENRVIE